MAWPCHPCEACPRVARGLSLPCRAQTAKHARFCQLASEGREDYIALLCDDVPPVPRAEKPRVPLGTKAGAKPGGD